MFWKWDYYICKEGWKEQCKGVGNVCLCAWSDIAISFNLRKPELGKIYLKFVACGAEYWQVVFWNNNELGSKQNINGEMEKTVVEEQIAF